MLHPDSHRPVNPATVATTIPVAKDLRVLVNSAYKIDPTALVRGRVHQTTRSTLGDEHGQMWADIFVTTPLGPIGMRRIRIEGLFNAEIAEHDEDGLAIAANGRNMEGMWTAKSVLEAIDAQLLSYSRSDQSAYPYSQTGESIVQLHISDAKANRWPGALPGAHGYQLIETISTEELAEVYNKTSQVAQDESGPMGIPPSLLNQKMITVTANEEEKKQWSTHSPAIDQVEITGRTIIALGALGFLGGDVARISASHMWIRIDTRVGTVYAARNGSINLLNFTQS